MDEQERYARELQKLAEKVENNFFGEIFGSDDANFRREQHKMLLEGLMREFDFSLTLDEDLEKVELYDYWKGENGSAGQTR